MSKAPLDTPDKLARFIVGMGYTYEACVNTLARDFPDLEDPRQVIYDAVQVVSRTNDALDEAIERDAERALAAEFDLSKSMHKEDEQ